MTRHLMIAALCATLAAPAIAAESAPSRTNATTLPPGAIAVSCYRGPWKEVIWDRPNPIFLKSLVALGYDYANARAIGETICRDQSLVGNNAGMRSMMQQIYADTASERRRIR